MARTTTVLNISVSPEENSQITQLAKEESKSKSAVIRDAVRSYRLKKNLDYIQEVGRKTAEAMGIETYEDIERIAG